MKQNLLLRPAIATGLILLVPLAMTIVDRHKAAGEGWRWGPGDFLVMGALLLLVGVAYELLARRLHGTAQRLALGLVVALVVVTVWVELAVGGVSQLIAWLAR